MPDINDQWQATEDRLKGRGKLSYYEITATRLTETGNEPYGRELYDWPIQMAQKVNFDYDQFVEAFRFALDHFAGQYEPPVDPDVLEASIKKGHEFDKAKHG